MEQGLGKNTEALREEATEGSSFSLFGIECGKGWKHLYQPIIDYVAEYNKDKDEDERIRIMQIKEKFGELRIYLSHYTEELDEMISEAEDKSYNTCETCGKYIEGPIEEHHWIYPLCRECYDKWKTKREEAFRKIQERLHDPKESTNSVADKT